MLSVFNFSEIKTAIKYVYHNQWQLEAKYQIASTMMLNYFNKLPEGQRLDKTIFTRFTSFDLV